MESVRSARVTRISFEGGWACGCGELHDVNDSCVLGGFEV